MFIDKLAITSPDLTALEPIPARFSADGGHAVPRMRIAGAPEGTVELALICHDPDAPMPRGFTHWAVYGIAPDAEHVALDAPGIRVGTNSAGTDGWYGPEPPHGHGVHHYYFWVYALSRPVEGTPSREDFLDAYADAIIEQARLVGTYQR